MLINSARPEDLFHTAIGIGFADITASPNTPATSISISLMSSGAPSTSNLMDGA
jgi:hypothetical protein